ncbi:MAG: hypothetical protein NZM37_11150, partial [Sandaracinaceae bacterium]|nr:hypothetical protein [Sandaracinaceae bacterium]
NLSGIVRHELTREVEWSVLPQAISLPQMELALGCDASELSCIERIGQNVGADYLVYGTLRRLGRGARFEFEAEFNLFSVKEVKILGTAKGRFPSIRVDIDDLRPLASDLASQLRRHFVAQREGAAPSTASPTPSSPSPSNHPASSSDDVFGRLNWPALISLGLALGAGIGWAITGLEAERNMKLVNRFRESGAVASETASDRSVCNPDNIRANEAALAAAGTTAERVINACTSPAEVLQFVFMGVTVAAAGVGAALLATGGIMSEDNRNKKGEISLRAFPGWQIGESRLELAVRFD